MSMEVALKARWMCEHLVFAAATAAAASPARGEAELTLPVHLRSLPLQ